MKELMKLQMEAIRHVSNERTERELTAHMSLIGRMKDKLQESIVTVEFGTMPDVQMEGFRILTTMGLKNMEKVLLCLAEEGYLSHMPFGCMEDEFGKVIDAEHKVVEIIQYDIPLPGSFIRSRRFNSQLLIDIALYQKELPRV